MSINTFFKHILTSIIFLIPLSGFSQVIFEPKFDIDVSEQEEGFANPWIGGLNSNQYNKADLDNDGKDELILYDRSANSFLIFKT